MYEEKRKDETSKTTSQDNIKREKQGKRQAGRSEWYTEKHNYKCYRQSENNFFDSKLKEKKILPSSASGPQQQHLHWHLGTLLAQPRLGGLIQSDKRKCTYQILKQIQPTKSRKLKTNNTSQSTMPKATPRLLNLNQTMQNKNEIKLVTQCQIISFF